MHGGTNPAIWANILCAAVILRKRMESDYLKERFHALSPSKAQRTADLNVGEIGY